jgi:hypothetical protein
MAECGFDKLNHRSVTEPVEVTDAVVSTNYLNYLITSITFLHASLYLSLPRFKNYLRKSF